MAVLLVVRQGKPRLAQLKQELENWITLTTDTDSVFYLSFLINPRCFTTPRREIYKMCRQITARIGENITWPDIGVTIGDNESRALLGEARELLR